VYAQVIDDKAGKTVAAAFGRSAEEVGEKVAKGALAAGTATAVFDRGEYKFHGKVKQVAESARKAGLKI
jgi:large subunit ribosomal protein L18